MKKRHIDYLQYLYAFQLSKWTMQNITGVPFRKPVYSFINMTKPEKSNISLNPNEQPYFEPFFTNKRKRVEISILESDPNFHCKVYLNQTHHLLHIPDIIKKASELGKK